MNNDGGWVDGSGKWAIDQPANVDCSSWNAIWSAA